MMISIHAPHRGSDPEAVGRNVLRQPISIHAPRGGATRTKSAAGLGFPYFNPRSPWGERPGYSKNMPQLWEFQSTLPVGGATWTPPGRPPPRRVSIHAPRGGSDNLGDYPVINQGGFNPRSPWGERPAVHGLNPFPGDVSIHAPRGGSDF